MKNYLNSVIVCAIFTLFVFSCNNENSENDVKTAKEKILELASIYELKVSVDDESLGKVANRIDYNKVKEEFEALSAIRGEYSFQRTRKDSSIVYEQKKEKET